MPKEAEQRSEDNSHMNCSNHATLTLTSPTWSDPARFTCVFRIIVPHGLVSRAVVAPTIGRLKMNWPGSPFCTMYHVPQQVGDQENAARMVCTVLAQGMPLEFGAVGVFRRAFVRRDYVPKLSHGF